MPEAPKSQRRTLLIITALFFVPLAAAFILYYGVGWRPAGGTNNGELLQPVRQMPEVYAPLLGKWNLVYVGDGQCDEDCRQALVLARQTRLSLNKDMERVNRLLLTTGNCCDLAYLDKEHPGLKVNDISEPAEDLEQWLLLLPPGDLRHWLFVVDPLGNIVMRYDVRKEPRGLLDDLKKLLKLSHIG
ncbi:MAG: hypothetical protein ABIQ86_00145 [Steroidobacteraceae bacterium]